MCEQMARVSNNRRDEGTGNVRTLMEPHTNTKGLTLCNVDTVLLECPYCVTPSQYADVAGSLILKAGELTLLFGKKKTLLFVWTPYTRRCLYDK